MGNFDSGWPPVAGAHADVPWQSAQVSGYTPTWRGVRTCSYAAPWHATQGSSRAWLVWCTFVAVQPLPTSASSAARVKGGAGAAHGSCMDNPEKQPRDLRNALSIRRKWARV